MDNLNNAVGDRQISLEDIVQNEAQNATPLRNHGGGHYNHCLFWLMMGGNGGAPKGKLLADIEKEWGNFDSFKEAYSNAAKGLFGSGWAWLSVGDGQKLQISTTPNQDNPFMKGVIANNAWPFMTLDVWEHAYYIDYQNRRPDFIKSWWDMLNWDNIERFYEDYALQGKPVPVLDHLN